jgi:hypothetical protein
MGTQVRGELTDKAAAVVAFEKKAHGHKTMFDALNKLLEDMFEVMK